MLISTLFLFDYYFYRSIHSHIAPQQTSMIHRIE